MDAHVGAKELDLQYMKVLIGLGATIHGCAIIIWMLALVLC